MHDKYLYENPQISQIRADLFPLASVLTAYVMSVILILKNRLYLLFIKRIR